MSGDLQLSGLRALVSGGTKGVGEAVVARLREAGVKVLTAYEIWLREQEIKEAAEKLAAEAKQPAPA